jgi:DNA repair exonuclease SbcCD ATPase subunit
MTDSTPTESELSTIPESHADVARLREYLAWTRESYNDSLKELQEFQTMSCADRLELEQLRQKLRDGDGGEEQQHWHESLQRLARDKADCERRIQQQANQLRELKELMQHLRRDNESLQERLAAQQQNADVACATGSAAATSNCCNYDDDLQEQVHKWEALYFESAETGAKKIEHLERRLESLHIQNQRLEQERKDAVAALISRYNNNNKNINIDIGETEKENFGNRISAPHIPFPNNMCIIMPSCDSQQQDEIGWMDRMDELEAQLAIRDETIAKLQQSMQEQRQRRQQQQQAKAAQQREKIKKQANQDLPCSDLALEALESAEDDDTDKYYAFGLEKKHQRAILDVFCCGSWVESQTPCLSMEHSN